MYLSKELLLAAYADLATLTVDPTQQGTTQKVSAIRYFIAMDAFIKQTGKNDCDTRQKDDKQAFVKCVADIVTISSSLYTSNFYWPLTDHGGDCCTGSNFFSATQVNASKTAPGKNFPYPKRSGWPSLLMANSGKVSIFAKGRSNGYHNIDWYIGDKKHCAAMFIWIARKWDAFSGANELSMELKNEALNHYSNELLEAIFPPESVFTDFLANIHEKYASEEQQITSEDIKSLFPHFLTMQSIQEGQLSFDSYQLITYGAPGTGKSWSVKQETQGKSCIRTTFHPDSDYSTFVGAYKPSMEADAYDTVVTTGEKTAGGTISKKDGLVRQKRIVYKFVAQAFLEAYVAAWRKCAAFLAAQDDEAKKAAVQFLVIEEINRGNCAQIFGDIFQLLDREDDGYSSYAIKADNDLQQYLKGEFDGNVTVGIAALDLTGVDLGDRDVTPDEITSGAKMLLPPNLFIRATMNTSDQSLFPIDSAFKRRWDWKYVPIKDEGKGWFVSAGGKKFDWWKFLQSINKIIYSETSSADKQLGYFFIKVREGDSEISSSTFVNKVAFYLWNDVFKDCELVNDAFKLKDAEGKTTGELTFTAFFKPDSDEVDEAVVEKFLTTLLKDVSGAITSAASADAGTDTNDAPNTGD